MSIKQKTVNGLIWSFIDNVAVMSASFIVSIILARLLSPREFGLIGMITIFIALSKILINSGFSSALIRKKDCTDTDYSTVFYFNLSLGFALYTALFFAAPLISRFFNEPELIKIIRVLSISIIIGSFTLIQNVILTKNINFKLQAKISIISTSLSGGIAVFLAYRGFGVWALVLQNLIFQGITSVLLWLWNRWKPLLTFSKKSFRELFGFGSKLLVSGLIDTTYNNIYYLIIGKFFSTQDLGYYTRAEGFNNLPSQNLNSIVGRVTYPVLSEMQDDKVRLKENYKKLISGVMFITFTLMMGLAAVAEPMIQTLIGAKWAPAIIYLQLLTFSGMFYPLHAMNLNMLQVLGRSDLFLKLEILKKLVAIPFIVFGVFYGIKALLIGMIFISIIAYYLNSTRSGELIEYSFKEQVKDILPSFILAVLMGIMTFFLGRILPLSFPLKFIIQLIFAITFIFTFSEITQFKEYIFIKDIAKAQLKKFN